jgi:hypothetical protein
MAVYPDIKIAPNWDNEAGFTVVEEIVVSGTTTQLEDVLKGFGFAANTQYFIVHGLPQQNRKITGTGVSLRNGFVTIEWRLPFISGRALEFWKDTYVGHVTIATLVYDIGTPVENWNAIAGFPEYPTEKIYRLGQWWVRDVIIRMNLVNLT